MQRCVLVLSLKMKILFLFLITSMSTNFQFYETIKVIENIEIRKYDEHIIASHISKDNQNNNFSILANYIFGNNSKSETIGMTSPVILDKKTNKMSFIMPERYLISNLPIPTNKEISIEVCKESYKAVIKYGGYTNSKKENKMIKTLKSKLEENNIIFFDDFEVLVYQSPYKILNRKNEIIVSINYDN